MRLAAVLALALTLAACQSREAETAQEEETLDSLAGPTATAPVVDQPVPNEVVSIDTGYVGSVTVERGDDTYIVDAVEGVVTTGGSARPLDRAALGTWLARLSPLRAEGSMDGVTPQAVQNEADATLIFEFTDGSGRTISFLRHGDAVAAVSQDDGPVWRLPMGVLDALVPTSAALTR